MGLRLFLFKLFYLYKMIEIPQQLTFITFFETLLRRKQTYFWLDQGQRKL